MVKNICLKINDIVFKTSGILKDNILVFNHDNNHYKFDIVNNIFIKEDSNFMLSFYFGKSFLILHDKLLNKDINIKLLINELQKRENNIIISYQIEEEIFNLLLSFTEE